MFLARISHSICLQEILQPVNVLLPVFIWQVGKDISNDCCHGSGASQIPSLSANVVFAGFIDPDQDDRTMNNKSDGNQQSSTLPEYSTYVYWKQPELKTEVHATCDHMYTVYIHRMF